MPSAALLLDLVRCLVVCPTADEAVVAYRVIASNFAVLRVKNSFTEGATEVGFRQVLVNVLFSDEISGLSMICEVQVNITAYARVKEQIHNLYSIARCAKPADVETLLTKGAF